MDARRNYTLRPQQSRCIDKRRISANIQLPYHAHQAQRRRASSPALASIFFSLPCLNHRFHSLYRGPKSAGGYHRNFAYSALDCFRMGMPGFGVFPESKELLIAKQAEDSPAEPASPSSPNALSKVLRRNDSGWRDYMATDSALPVGKPRRVRCRGCGGHCLGEPTAENSCARE